MDITTTIIGLVVVALLTTVLYRRYFHPLAGFPGPAVASVTYLYEWYYDVWLGGKSTLKLRELHKRYGPVVRLNPNELHFNDPNFYDEVFNMSNAPIEKPFKHAAAFGPFGAAVSTVEHDLHRTRRNAVNPFFSRRSVHEILPYLQPIVDSLCQRFDEATKTSEAVNLKYAYAALTMDCMEEYCFSKHADRVSRPDFGRRAFDTIDGFLEMSLISVHFAWLLWPLFYLPDSIIRRTSSAIADMFDEREELSVQVEAIRNGIDRSHETSGHRTIFHDLLSSNLPTAEMAKDRLRDEAYSLLAAGSGTTSHILKTTTYHIMANPSIHAKLLTSLRETMPNRDDDPVLADLEKLPYLTAIILESLRLNNAIYHRLIRSFPKKSLTYGGTYIPPGTIIGMTSLLIHENEEIFPDPHVFRPERWLGDEKDRKHLQKYLVPFSRGSRACLGLNLAWAELYVILAVVFRRFEFDISAVDRARDVDCSRDLLISAPAKASPGIMVKVMPIY